MQRIVFALTACLLVIFAVTFCSQGIATTNEDQLKRGLTTDNTPLAKTEGEAPSQGASATSGEKIFQDKCALCHTIGGGKKIGPDLKGVTERRPHDWLVKFISDPEKMYSEGDPTAAALLKEYNGFKMPSAGLNEEQVNDVIAYLQSKGGNQEVPPPAENK